ncbi:MAG: PKD domain-containing protein, partial [Flavobacteriales bacterium]|nr:PKD domain-containing protein [Flavobacteriales bacterium]
TRINRPAETAGITAQVINPIPGATYTTSPISFDSILISIDWTPTLADAGSQYFSIQGTVLNCPINYESNQSYRITVDSFPPPIPNPIAVNAKCNNSMDGKAFHNASNLISGYTLEWLDESNNILSTSDTLSNQNPGTYYLAIRNGAKYGVVRDTLVIGNNQFGGLLSAFTLNPPVGCASPHTVFFTDQSILPDTWLWDFGDGNNSTLQNPIHNFVSTGSFPISLTVVDTITGCNSVSTSLVKLSITTANFTGAALFGCGPLKVNFSDNSTSSGSSLASWSWSFGDGGVSTLQNPSYTYGKPGVYAVSLTVVDNNGCRDSKTRTNYVQVIGPDVNFGADTSGGPIPLSINFTDSTIFGAPIIGWTWSFGDGASSNLQNPTHIYTTPDTVDVRLTVRDIDGCSRTFIRNNYITVGLLSSMQISDSISCNSADDGEITATAIGGTPPYSYAWSSGETTQTIVGKSPTNYTVSITDAGGVMANSTLTLTEPISISASIASQSNALCFGTNTGAATASGSNGVAPYTYTWSNGATTATASNLGAGTYTVSVSDANNCTPGIAMLTISEPTALNGDSTVVNVDCHHAATGSATVNVTGGTGTYTYSWISGETTPNITNKAADVYPVTIYDANACGPLIIPVLIEEPHDLEIEIDTSFNITCNGLNNGLTVAHSHGGVSPYTFSWSNGSAIDSAKNLAPGTYTVSINDANSCGPFTTTVSISEPVVLAVIVSVDSNVTCNGISDGGATASATGGTLPYTYNWNNAATTASITGIVAGNYTVTITDNNNCTASNSITITEPTVLSSTSQLDSNVSCNSGSDGGAKVIPSGGTTPYTYAWSNSATTSVITGVPAASYTVTITDKNGCTSIGSKSITEPAVLALTLRVDSNVTCTGLSDGGATAIASGGTLAYSYLWSNAVTTSSNQGISNVNYSVTLTDSKGCSATQAVMILVVDTIKPLALTQNVSAYSDATGNTSIVVADINNGSSDACGIATLSLDSTQFDCTEIGTNTVYFRVIDVNGNLDSASAVVTVIDTISPTVLTQNLSIYLNAAGTANITTTDINNGSSDNCSIVSLSLDSTSFDCSEVGANTVQLMVTDVNGNIDSADAVVTVVDTIRPTVLTQNISIYLNATGTASISTADINNGSSDNCSIATITLDSTQFDCAEVGVNTVYLTVTDVNGNASTSSATVMVFDTIRPTVLTQNVSLYLNANGTASITIADINNGSSDNCTIATITLDSTLFDCSEVGANTVYLRVTDVNGNLDSTSAVVTVIDTIRPTVIGQNISVYLAANGTATITAADLNNGNLDNCSIASFVIDSTQFDCSEIGA